MNWPARKPALIPHKDDMKKIFSFFLRVVVSFGLLAGLLWIMRKDMHVIGQALYTCNIKFLVVAMTMFIFTISILSLRMKIVFNGENLKISIWESVQLNFMGYFFNNFLPTSVGGDIMKAYYASLRNKSKVKSYASVIMDRIIGLYAFLIIAGIALLVDNGKFDMPTLRPLVFSLIAVGIFVFFIITNRSVAGFMERVFMRLKMGNLGERLDSVYKIVHDYRNRLDVVLKSLMISVVSQTVNFAAIYVFFLALGSDVKIGNVFLIMPVVTFISMIPSLGGLGVREGAMVAFFTPISGKEIAFAVSILVLLSLFVASIIGGLIYVYWLLFKLKDKRAFAGQK